MSLIGLAVIATFGLVPIDSIAQTRLNRTVTIESDSSVYGGYISVVANKSRILRVAEPVERLLLGSEDIADVLPLTDRTIYVLGKKIGATSLSIYGTDQQLIAVLDLEVTYDTQSLKRELFQLMPNEKIEVRGSSGGLVLSGMVSTGTSVAKAVAMAERYAPGQTSNFLSVRQSEQVMLKVRFAEIKRTAAKALGIHSDILFNDGSNSINFLSGFLDPTAFANILGSYVNGNWDIGYFLDALETKGVLTTLAEPTLIAMSGETASFLAGGEFPIPVAQSSAATNDGAAAITVEFKEFGVSLSFTPTVIGDVINLVVTPEVSAIDTQTIVEINGFAVPGLVTRRATTTVELRNGQSFAIAGLLQDEFTNAVDQFPGFGDLPIIGALLRSSEYRRQETELLIVITPYFVQPSNGELPLPTDDYVVPSEFQLFLLGKVDQQVRAVAGNQAGNKSTAETIDSYGGLDGVVGYVIE